MVLDELAKEGAVKELWSEWEMEMEDLRMEFVAIDEKIDEIEEGWAQWENLREDKAPKWMIIKRVRTCTEEIPRITWKLYFKMVKILFCP